MDFRVWTLVALLCTLTYYYLKKRLNFFKDRGVPYVPSVPLIGSMWPGLFRFEHISDTVMNIYNYNPETKYIGLFDFNSPLVMIRDPELIKSIAIKHFDNFPDHKTVIDANLDELFGGNLFNMSGERWKEARSMLSPAFTSSKMKAMFELMVECGKNMINYLLEQPKESYEMVNTKDLFTKYTNDVIATCAFGISIDSLKDPKNQFYVYGSKVTTFDTRMMMKFFMAKCCPWVYRILKIRFTNEKIAKFFKDVVSSTVATRDEKGITRPDMLQLMMDARGRDSKCLKMDITEMTAQAFVFYFAGFDTTSTQMCVIAHELAVNPEYQKTLQNEIDDVLRECNGKPTYEAINAMAYMDAVFNEALRCHSQLSFLDRLCVSPFELPPALPGAKPFTVKPGMNVWIPASAIHMDPKYYENPKKFDPERYYNKKVTINDVNNLGFGIGPRSCIGNRFAILETKILIFSLLSKFNFKPNVKTCYPIKYSTTTFQVRPVDGFWLSLERRN